jgi:hypothetical protein
VGPGGRDDLTAVVRAAGIRGGMMRLLDTFTADLDDGPLTVFRR